ncbi:MAG: PEGA domain-containing protein [Treponema sp.]|jgi:hypothetical protein|nr:PEGA domain-containing protein [Treponema sp.]
MRGLKRIGVLIFIIILAPVFKTEAQTQETIQQPVRSTQSEDKTATVTIRTNIRNATIYLNNEYQGYTPLKVKNLTPGQYLVSVKKNGYETRNFPIRLEAGQDKIYYIELEKITGWIKFKNLQSESLIYVDGQQYFTNPVELQEGFHTVKVRRFGYTDYTETVWIQRQSRQSLSVTMAPAVFSLSGLTASRNPFNPGNPGALGKTILGFYVTAPESGTMVLRTASGSVVNTWNFSRFTTWQQTITWDGTDMYGNRVPDGIYTATVAAGSYTVSCPVTIDSSITYNLSSITTDGTGIGSVPTVLLYPQNTLFADFSINPLFKITGDEKRIPLALTAALGGTPLNGVEWTFRAALYPNGDTAVTSFGGSLKAAGSAGTSVNKFLYGGIIRYGYSSEITEYAPIMDSGNGLGTGIILGYKTAFFYTGFSSDYIFSCMTGDFSGNDSCWKNGLAVQFMPTSYMALKTWGTLNSRFGDTGTDKKISEAAHWISAVDTGLEITMLLPNSAILLNAGAYTVLQLHSAASFGIKAGIGFLF